MGQRAEELTTGIEGTREDLGRNLDALNERVNPVRVVERRKEAARGRVSTLKDRVMGSAHGARGSASGAATSVTDTMAGAPGAVQSRTEGNPLAAGVIAFGAGWLLSSLLPASETETQATQKLMDTAKDSGLVDEARSVGQDVGQNLKTSATQAADEVRSSAQQSAQHVKEEGQSSAQTVQRDVSDRTP
jgi:gas vesicle protein